MTKETKRTKLQLLEEIDALRERVTELESKQEKAESAAHATVAVSDGSTGRSDHLMAVLEVTSDMVSTSTMDGRITHMNSAGCRLMGWPENESPVGKRIPDAHPQWAFDIVASTGIPAAIRDGIWEGETALLTPAGEETPVSQVIMCHRSASGEPEFLSTIIRDITELKRAEQEFRESEERFRNIVQASPMGMYLYDLQEDGRLVLVDSNAAADGFTGIENQALLGKTIEEAFPALAETEVPQRYRAAAREGIPWQTESLQYEDDRIAGAFDVFAFQTSPNRMAVLFQEITERKQAEEELKRLRNLLRSIFDSMPSVLIGVDEEGRVNQWNRAAEAATSLSAQAAIGKPLGDVYPFLTEQLVDLRDTIHLGEPGGAAKVPHDVDGELRYADLTVFPHKAEGIKGAVIRIDDVTERIRLEEMIVQSEKMLSVGGLAAGMAHELNNPLAGIMQNVQVMRSRLSVDLPANLKAAAACGTTLEQIEAYMAARNIPEMINAIVESGKRAAGIVESMLNFSRKSQSVFVPHNLADLLDETVELASKDYDLKKKYDFRRFAITREYEPGLPLVSCEAASIQQVFLNLLKNGAEAMSDHQSAGPASFVLRLAREHSHVRVEVEDNGPGMSEEVRRRVFEPFFTTKDVGVGTGLGLSVSYFIVVETHGGVMSVESIRGRGARFIVRLPIERHGN